MSSPTSLSNSVWLDKHPLKVKRYLRRNFKREDYPTVIGMLYTYPDEGRKLIENFDLTNEEKWSIIFDFIVRSKQITAIFFGDQRMGKDASVCYVLGELIRLGADFRVCTLLNMRKPPFVADDDMFFSFKRLPVGTRERPVIVYCSELESAFPAREGASAENRLFSTLEGTMAQNHQRLFGCVKLAARVDLNVIRSCNMRFFKYISPDKLNVEGVERDGIISGLAQLLLPSDRDDPSSMLVCFDSNIFLVSNPLPEWYNDNYSEMFRDAPLDKVKEYIEACVSNGMKADQICMAVSGKFRVNYSVSEMSSLIAEL